MQINSLQENKSKIMEELNHLEEEKVKKMSRLDGSNGSNEKLR